MDDTGQQPYINFVRSTSQLHSVLKEQPGTSISPESGETVSKFYESIVSTQESSSPKPVTQIRKLQQSAPPQTTPQPNTSIKPNDIFKFVQNGKIKECQQWLAAGFDVNLRDGYHWTPLMVASCAGHGLIVKLLLANGADCSLRCNKGLSAMDLAKKSAHGQVIALLADSVKPKTKIDRPRRRPASTSKAPIASFECDWCGPVTGTERAVHDSSIEHQLKSEQFSSEQTRSLGHYAHVNRNFKGYQLLLKEGWNGCTGLGAREDGRRYPIKAHKKPDRACIGLPQTSEYKQEEVAARVPKLKLKHTLISDKRRQRRIEAEFRRSFRELS